MMAHTHTAGGDTHSWHTWGAVRGAGVLAGVLHAKKEDKQVVAHVLSPKTIEGREGEKSRVFLFILGTLYI